MFFRLGSLRPYGEAYELRPYGRKNPLLRCRMGTSRQGMRIYIGTAAMPPTLSFGV